MEKLNDKFEEQPNKLIHNMISASKTENIIAKIMEKTHEAIIQFSCLPFTLLIKFTLNRIEKTSIVSSKINKLNLPKIGFRKFSGDIKDWLQFWGLFKKIDEMIKWKMMTGENYGKAIESLKSRYGRDELLIEYYFRELLNLMRNISPTKLIKPHRTTKWNLN